MGALADLQTQAKTFKTSSPLGQWIATEIVKKTDGDVPASAAVVNEVQSIADSTMTSGNMTLTFAIKQADGTVEEFTTGNIDFEETSAAIETIIDVAATAASITGWTNGDISVSGTAMDDGPITLTYDGASVAGQVHALPVLVNVDGAGGAWGAITRTTAGQSARPAMAVLYNYGLVATPFVEQDAVASSDGVTVGGKLVSVPDNIVKALMREASAEDYNQGTYFSLQAALYPQDRAPMLPASKTSDVLDD